MDHLRRVLRSPLHFFLCTCAVIVAAGSAAVVFTFMNALWFRPPSIDDPARLVVIVRPGGGMRAGSLFSDLALTGFRDMGVFGGVAGQATTNVTSTDLTPLLTLGRAGQVVETVGVTENYFSVLGVPVRGRDFSAEDTWPGAPTVAIISDDLWRRSYQGDPGVIGSVVPASPFPVRIIGIAPVRFGGALKGERVHVWLPYTQLPALAGAAAPRNGIPMINFCRMRPGATVEGTRHAFLTALASQGRSIDGLDVVALGDLFGAPDIPLVVVRNTDMVRLVGAVALLLVAAGCTTLIALLLAHYQHRQREMIVRVALGATRLDLLRQVAAELALIVVTATIGVLAVSAAAVKVLPTFTLPGGIDLSRLDLTPDWRVLLLTAMTCLLLVAVAAIVPVLRVAGPSVRVGLNDSAATGTPRALRTRRVVLGVHAGLTVLILVMAGLFVQSAIHALTNGPGFDYEKTLFVSVGMPARPGRIEDPSTRTAYERFGNAAEQLFESIRALPEIENAALGGPPLGTRGARLLEQVSVVRTDEGSHDLRVASHVVGPGYMQTLGVPMVLGHEPAALGQFVISTTLAAEAWPSQSPIGRPLECNGARGIVAGVVDMGFASVRLGRPGVFFIFDATSNSPAALENRKRFDFVIRSSNLAEARQIVSERVRAAFPDASFVRLTSGTELVDGDLGQERLGAWFLSVVGASAWLLGVASVFGLVGYVVECRRREFGVRMALGASTQDLLRRATWAGAAPTMVGGICGLVAAVWLGEIVEGFLLGIRGVDLQTYVAAFGLFVATACVAGLVAAFRVRHIHPVQALRAE